MKVGDLVVQKGWEADGAGIVIRVWNPGSVRGRITVQWHKGVVDMYRTQLEVISESR